MDSTKICKATRFLLCMRKLGHSYKNCEKFVDGMGEDDLQYESWLRASPLKFR